MTKLVLRACTRTHVSRTSYDVGGWNLRIWLVFFPLTTHVEGGYGSFFFLFSIFCNATREYLYCHNMEACMYVCMYVWVCTIGRWPDPLCWHREVDTKRVANGLRFTTFSLTRHSALSPRRRKRRTDFPHYLSLSFSPITVNYPV